MVSRFHWRWGGFGAISWAVGGFAVVSRFRRHQGTFSCIRVVSERFRGQWVAFTGGGEFFAGNRAVSG